METSSARHAPTPSPPRISMAWIAMGLGIFLILASLWVEFAGATVWSGILEPASQSDGISTYITPEILLEPGTYAMHLHYSQSPRILRTTTGRYGVTVSSSGLPGWLAAGSLTRNTGKKRSAAHRAVSGDIVIHVPSHLEAPLDLEVEGAEKAPLSVRLRRTRIDYRIPLWAGFALMGLGIAMDPSLRTRLRGFLGLTNSCDLPPPR